MRKVLIGVVMVITGLGRVLFGSRPVPLRIVRACRRMLPGADALVPRTAARDRDPSSLDDPFLREALSGTELGGWALDASTINALGREIASLRPQQVLEFGSGVSTLCLAHLVGRYRPDTDGPLVHSIDQDPEWLRKSRSLVAAAGLEDRVVFHHAPLVRTEAFGRSLSAYDLSETTLAALAEWRPSMVFIDGPAAEDGARVGTLPAIAEIAAPEATFYLDDALRDGELAAAVLWQQSGLARVEGIILVGSGLLRGRIRF